MTEKLTRRSFFQMAVAVSAVVPFAFKATQALGADSCYKSPPAGKALGSPTEGMGKNLEYVLDANSTKNPKHKAGNSCANCKFFNLGKVEGGYAPCTMMGMKYVSNCGWCKSYLQKT